MLGHAVDVKFYVSHEFHPNGTVAMSVVPIHGPPIGKFAEYSCLDVPVTVNATTCEITIEDDCTRAADKRNFVTKMQYVWDGGITIRVYETLTTPIFRRVFTWDEHPVDPSPSPGLVAAVMPKDPDALYI